MRRLLTAAGCACVLLGAACTTSGTPSSVTHPAPSTPTRPHAQSRSHPPTSPPATSSAASSAPSSTAPSSSSSSSAAPPDAAQRVLQSMSEAQRVGQLLMVDCPSSGVAGATVTAIRQYHVGSVILDGNSSIGVTGTQRITSQLQDDAPKHRKLFISTDQEGGLVQRMRGPGFSAIPSAVSQRQLSPGALRDDARTWGVQLHDAGINVDLAPVLDTVPPGDTNNPPIGDLDREYGHSPGVVKKHGLAFARGLTAAGVAATVKHFPGLGRVTGNTDTTSGVTDPTTTRDDPYLRPFKAAVRAGVPFVMVGTAIYSQIDPGTPAAFSKTIVTGMLRNDLGFGGVAITDDVGGAAQVSSYPVGDRAVRFIAAGGDMVLTVVAGQAATMTAALLAKAQRSPSFKAKVDAAALRVLEVKDRFGLLG